MADEGQTVEDLMTSISGNVLENDTDIDNGTVLTVADHGNQVGEYGTLSVAADGKYTYALDNEDAVVQTLGRSHEKTETFAYSATDGIVDVASTLSIQVNGVNDAPILVAPLADQDFTFHKPFEWQMPADSFVDIDQGDVLDYSATLADGSPLPDWISFDPTTQTFSGWTPKMVGSIDICVTATDRVESTGSTEGSLSASDVFTFSISHSNQGVGNGEDAAPPGQDTNFNDGPGTSPGGPGAKDKKTAVAAQTTVTYLDLSQVNTLMGTSAVQPVATAEGEIFAGWQNMQAAVNDDSLLYDKGAWSDDRQGADVSSMNKAMSGLLSSTQPFGLDGSELTPSNSTLLKVNNGKKS
jgi:VCBS repeat-containing protein